jgi:hypoxanthine phosphoribosyltransferase
MQNDITKDFVNWNSIHLYCQTIANKVKKPNLIIGIAGGGLIPTSIIARHLKCYNILYIALRSYNIDNTQSNEMEMYHVPEMSFQDRDQQVLVIDDILDTGNTFKYMDWYLKSRDFKNIQYAALHHKIKDTNIQHIPNDFIYGTQCQNTSWIEYPWEIN